ncbi:MAG: hypothetical protein JNJ70_23615 [Verrucomicrobiales bacterium]|nr:hypothetical protein [Verrucomicrobiales bacterium]
MNRCLHVFRMFVELDHGETAFSRVVQAPIRFLSLLIHSSKSVHWRRNDELHLPPGIPPRFEGFRLHPPDIIPHADKWISGKEPLENTPSIQLYAPEKVLRIRMVLDNFSDHSPVGFRPSWFRSKGRRTLLALGCRVIRGSNRI